MPSFDFDFQRYIERKKGAREAEAREGSAYAYAGDLRLRRTVLRLRPVALTVEATVRLWRATARAEVLGPAVRATDRSYPAVHAAAIAAAGALHVALVPVSVSPGLPVAAGVFGTDEEPQLLVHAGLAEAFVSPGAAPTAPPPPELVFVMVILFYLSERLFPCRFPNRQLEGSRCRRLRQNLSNVYCQFLGRCVMVAKEKDFLSKLNSRFHHRGNGFHLWVDTDYTTESFDGLKLVFDHGLGRVGEGYRLAIQLGSHGIKISPADVEARVIGHFRSGTLVTLGHTKSAFHSQHQLQFPCVSRTHRKVPFLSLAECQLIREVVDAIADHERTECFYC